MSTVARSTIDPELVALLVCPETRQDLALASEAEIGRLNEAIRQGLVKTVEGKEGVPVDGALIRQDRARAYPIRDGIPVMLVAEGLDLSKLPS